MSQSNKILMVNADDFGWSESVNRGIVDCFKNGIVTSTSLLATGEAFGHAVKLSTESPGLRVGVHLNFYRGTALLPESGQLPGSVSKFVTGMLCGKYKTEQIEQEFRAQIKKVISAGIKIDHLNSEKHLHLWPSLFRIVARLAEEYKIGYVRIVTEDFSITPVALPLTLLSLYNHKIVETSDFKVSDQTMGVTESPTSLLKLDRILAGGGEGLTELVVHPGYLDEGFWDLQKKVNNKLTYSREAEAKVLGSVEAKNLVTKYGYTLDRHTA